jgi:hypothetical protein
MGRPGFDAFLNGDSLHFNSSSTVRGEAKGEL